jgi:hypothetical protein
MIVFHKFVSLSSSLALITAPFGECEQDAQSTGAGPPSIARDTLFWARAAADRSGATVDRQ